MSSTRSCGSSSSNSNNSNSSNHNHMPARRANSSRRTSESSSAPGTSSTSTTSTARQQHVADKSAVKRKKRRKDEDEESKQQRVPVVLLTRLEEPKKPNEIKDKRVVTEVKVVVERTRVIESIRAPLVVVGKKNIRHPVHRSSENLVVVGDVKVTEPIVRKEEKIEKVVAVVVEDTLKVPPKKSIESAKSSESRSCKVKSDDRKPADRSAERNVHNVNNDNNRKTIDPKITERRLVVKLDRSEVQNYFAKQRVQRLHAEAAEEVDKSEIDKYHSESETQDDDVASKTSTENKTCAITSDDGEIQNDTVEKAPVDDVTDRVKEAQKTDVTDKVKEKKKTDVKDKDKKAKKTDVEKPPVESGVTRRGRPRKGKSVDEPVESAVKNQRLSSSREKRKAKSQDAARKGNKTSSDKDLRDDTKIHEDSSVQVNKNQIEHLDESPKDTSCKSAKSSRSSERLNKSTVVNSEQVSSETIETDKIVESNTGSDNESSVTAAVEPVPLPMEVDEIPHERTVVDDSKAEDESAQQICDIHSKNVDEDAETLLEEAETVDKSTEEVLPEATTDNLVDSESSESPLENLVSSISTECPTKSSEEDETCESAKNLLTSETSENLVNGEVESPTDSFMSCENAESANEESMSVENNDLIETLEDTESTASTCTLIEETPEELSKELDAQEELPEDVEKPEEEPAEEDAHKEPESIQELPEVVAEKEDDVRTDKLDESFSSDDNKVNEHESTFENNLKSVENLVIDSILNGEIVSPKMIVQSAANRVEEVQSFVFEGGVEDFVNDIEASKAVSLEPTTPVEEVPSLENLEPSPAVAETLAPSVPIEEPALVESSASLEEPAAAETLPLEPLPSAEQEEPLESPPATEEAASKEISEPTEEPPVDEEFAKHRRKHALSELKKKCTENIDRRQALEETCNDGNTDREEDEQPPPPSTFGVENQSDVGDLQVPSSELASTDCYPEPTTVSTENYFENMSDAGSEICLAERLSQLSDLKIPSLEEPLVSEKSAMSDGEESTRSDHTKRQRILMKITKTDVNKHVTHLVDSKEEEETPLPSNTEQFATDQVTEGEIKIIMRKESSSNNHVIKEIKIIPRTPEGNNSARIPGYSPTSSDLSSGNSSCRVPSCSPAKPDSGSYRMPGWSPASTEIGQTTSTATTKKKQGRPKKYPIFTDAELIAKTTAIVNNGDVHAANKLADKPLFEPVESIRINEDDEVERDDEEEEQQTVITEQTCLSGSQLLEAMPAQPEIAAELTRKIEEDQSSLKKKKKKMGRPRKYPLPDDDAGTKAIVSENVSVARIEFNVVDSIEEFVEDPVKEIPSLVASSPVKKRGRPRKYPVESVMNTSLDSSGIEESETIVESALIHEVPSDKKARLFAEDGDANSSMTEDDAAKTYVERRRKPYKCLKDLLNTSPEIRPADDVDSQTEDEAPVVAPYVERRGRKPKHLKNLNRAVEENSTTENEVVSDASPVKPYVERRGRKPWKHLKDLNKLSESQVAENSTTENEAASAKPYVERRGRKPWKHLKNAAALTENQVGDESQTEDETPVAAPYVERRGRKPWKHLKNANALTENQVGDDSQTEDETPVVAPYVERRGRKPWKHLKNANALIENQVGDDSQTEDETPVAAPYVERRGRKPWKHLKNLEKSLENQDMSTTENDAVSDAPPAKVERRGRKPKHLKTIEKSTENQVAEDADSQTEDETPVVAPYVERRGRKPKHLKNINKSIENQVAEDADSQTEDETPVTAPYVERRGRKPKHLKNINKSTENQVAEDADSQTEDETSAAAPYVERRGRKPWKHLKNLGKSENQATEDADSQTEDETPATEPYVERRGRKPKHLKNIDKSTDNQVAEDADSQTEDETPATAPYVERRGRKPWKHLKDTNESSKNKVAEQKNSVAENKATSDASPTKVERRGRKPSKHLKDANKSSGIQDAEETNSQTEDETIQDNLETEQTQKLAELSADEGATSMTEDESADDTYAEKSREPLENTDASSGEKTSSLTENESADGTVAAKPYVEKRGRKPSKHLKNLEKQDMSATETDAMSDASPTKIDKRGRPRKIKKVPLPLQDGEKRKRGRPRLYPRQGENQAVEEVNSESLQDVQTEEQTSPMNEEEPVNNDGAVEPVVQEKEAPSELTEDDEPAVSENVVTEEPASNADHEIGSDTPLSEVIVKKKRGRKSLKDSEDTAVTSVAEEANSMTEDESADEEALITEPTVVADKPPVVSSPEKKKRGRPLKNQPTAEVSLPVNQTAEEASSMTEDNVPAVEPIVKKRGRPRKNSQDETIPEIAVAQEASPVTEDETVSSTEDIPTSDNLVQKRAKSVSPVKIARNQVVEQPSSQTEDETVSSTEDIPAVDQPQQPHIVKKVKFAKLPKISHTSDSSSTPSGSSVEDSTSMEPPVVKKRGRPPKIARQADSTLPDTNDSVDTTEDETVSSTEDVPTGEQPVAKKKQGRPKKNLPSFELEMTNSLAASSVEDLSTFEQPAPKKRGRKPHVRFQDDSAMEETSSIAASSMEDLSAVEAPVVVKKKRGRKPRALIQDDSTCSDSIAASSMEDLSGLVPPPIFIKKRGRPPKIPRLPGDMSVDSIEDKQMLSPVKKKAPQQLNVSFGHSIFDDNAQVVHDRSLSPVKKRGRPPKYPRENVEVPKRVSIVENTENISTPTAEQQPPVLEKRKGRLPRRLSQDENFLPSIIRNENRLTGRRSSHDSGVTPTFSLSDGGETIPSLGKRQGRPPRKFSPDEENSFSALPQPTVNHVQIENESPKKLGRPPIRRNSHDNGVPMSQSPISDSDETSNLAKRRGRPPKKFALDDGFTSGGETSPTKRRGRPPKFLQEESLQPVVSETKEPPPQDVSLPPVVPCVLSSNVDVANVKKTPTITTTNLLRQQRKPKMAQPQPVVPPPVIVEPVPQLNEVPPPPPSPVKKRGRPKLLPSFDIGAKLQQDELPDGMTIEQLRRRRHSQDDSMFSTEVRPTLLAARPKEFEDAQPRKRRGRPPKILSQPFALEPMKQVPTVEEAVVQPASIEDSPKLKERLNRPCKTSPEKPEETEPENTSKLTAADYLRTWTDRDDSPAPQTTQQPTKKPGNRQRRFSQDFTLEESSRPSSRNRLRRYSQGDALDDTSNDELRFNARKRLRSSGSDSSIGQDEKRPRVERDLCDQHSITKELVVQLTKIDNSEEPAPPCQQLQPISSDLVRMNLRRKLESNNNSSLEPPPLVPIEPNRFQPPTHSDAKLLMLMQPSEDKTLMQATPQPTQSQQMQPPTQQFCIIFIPDALTSSESSMSKDSQPTATIVNFQPVPDSELANKSVIYTPTTPTKIFVNSSVEEQQRHRSFLCTTCTQALDLVGRMEANMGMTEEDKCAIKCPFCSNAFQSVFYLEYHLRQEHLKCENERQCRHPGFNTLRIPSHDAAASESEIYITFALKCRSCYELFDGVHSLNEHVKTKHANLIRLHKTPPLVSGMVYYPPPPPPTSSSSPFKNGARPELLHCPSDCICRVGIRSTDSPMQRAQMLKRCPNFMRRLEKIEAAAYEVYTCTLCKSTFLMKDEVVEHLMKMHEVACKFPCTKCLVSFRSLQLQEAHHCSETTIRDLDKLLNIVIVPTDKAHDASKFEDSSNDELGPMKTTPPPAVPSASTPLNGVKRKNGVVIQRLTRFLAMQPPKKPRLDGPPGTPVTSKKRQKTPCPKCQKKFAYRKSLNDHIIFEHIIPCKADEASKNMAVELLRLINNGGADKARIEELATALGKYTDDSEGLSLTKLTTMDEQENWNETQHDERNNMMQCVKCKANFRVPANSANLTRRNNHQRTESPIPQLCPGCDPTRRRRNNTVNNGHKFNNAKQPVNGDQVRYTYVCDSCGDSFPTTIELNSHKQREHSNRPSDELKCEVCSRLFFSSRMLEKHKKLHHDASHDDDHSLNSSRADDDDDSMNCSLNNHSSVMDVSKDSETTLNDTANSSTTSRRDSSDGNNKDEEEACKCPRCDFSAEKVSLKNHLKREHGIMAFICQFCGKLLVEISEVRHMLDYHIKSSRKNGGVAAILNCSGDEVTELLRTLGKKRLQSLMIYHDFEGKCNNAIMRCPICPEQFATRESCRHHYQWMHDCTCILCDASFGGGNLAGQHKVAVHNSIASYVWAIQRLVSAIVHGLRLDRAHPSHVLYQEVSMRLDALEQQDIIESEMLATARATQNGKSGEEAVVVVPEPFLEPVVLSEDQLPGSGNMIEVVIGNDMVVEDSEDNLLENFYLSPNYESSCEQPRILDAGAPIPELEEEEEVVTTTVPVAITPAMVNACATIAVPTTPSITTSNGGILIPTTPVTAETYATSAVFKLRQDNGQEEVVLAITDEDLVTYRDDIGSLAEKLSATCDSLSLEEITTMLRSYFENVGTPQTEEVVVEQQQQQQQFANAIEPRTQ